MPQHQRSLKYEYELYVEQEIEAYKESVPRNVLLRIGDEAVSLMAAEQQLALTDILLCDEVNRIIRKRIRIPSHSTWCRRRLNSLREFKRPERWGLTPDAAICRTAPLSSEGRVLVANPRDEGSAIYLAANGCDVTTVDPQEDIVEKIIRAALEVGLTGKVRGFVADLLTWAPDVPLNAIYCGFAAFSRLSFAEREQVIGALQGATAAGGVNVVEQIGGTDRVVILQQLEASYSGWQVTVEQNGSAAATFLAKKVA